MAAVLDVTRNPGQDGTIFVQLGGSYEKGKTIAVPGVTLSVEHFGRMARLLEKKVRVEVEMNVETTFYDEDDKAYNTLAEIPGVDPSLKDQVVMLGGHLDSWHAGEGPRTTARARLSDGIRAPAQEAWRPAPANHPHRTLVGRGRRAARLARLRERTLSDRGRKPPSPRISGSGVHCRPPAGPLELKPEQEAVSVYFNLDNGADMIRGVSLQENAR